MQLLSSITFFLALLTAASVSHGAVTAGESSPGSADSKATAPAGSTARPVKPAPAGAALIQNVLPSWLQFGVAARGRFEAPSGIGYVPGASDRDYLSRLRFDLGVRPAAWLRFYAQAQDARAFSYDSAPVPSSVYNPWDLKQAYVEIGGGEGRPAQFRFGRQEMQFGAGRLISAPDWGNVGRSFDGSRMSLSGAGMKADLFATSVVQVDSTRFDRHKPGEHLYGGYFSLGNLGPRMTVEPYLLARTQLRVTGERGDVGNSHLYTGGARVTGKLPGRFDYSAELMEQWGYSSSDGIRALAGAYTAGWTVMNDLWKPRVSFEVSHASGDRANKDGVRNTFDQLYAGLHSHVGVADQIGQRNTRNYKIGVDVSPSRKFKAAIDFRGLYLATVQDGFYNSGGSRVVLNRNATSTHVGNELDFQASYALPQGINVAAGYGRVFAGAYLKQSTKGSGYSFPYVMWAKRF